MDSANPGTGQQARPSVPSAPYNAWRGTFAIPAGPSVRRPQIRRDRIWFRQTAAKLLRAPFTRETGRQIEYAVLGLLLAILRHALLHQHERIDEADGQQDIERSTRHIHPEAADAGGGAAP